MASEQRTESRGWEGSSGRTEDRGVLAIDVIRLRRVPPVIADRVTDPKRFVPARDG